MTTSLTAAARRYFGKRPGTTTQDFVNELKALTADDKAEFAGLLSTELDQPVEVTGATS